MIEYVIGNILNADVQAIVMGVSLDGIMDHKQVLDVEKVFPSFYSDYTQMCFKKHISIGKVGLTHRHKIDNPHYLIHFPIADTFNGVIHIEDIELGLSSLLGFIKEYKVKSIAIPPLGVDILGLRWKEAKALFVHTFTPLNELKVLLYEPDPPF
ncbi:MAG: hypothetical protein EOM67_09395 [Spirochaetia bacterium]|nr:hypothetical protein [Spirochaetia bacterium]